MVPTKLWGPSSWEYILQLHTFQLQPEQPRACTSMSVSAQLLNLQPLATRTVLLKIFNASFYFFSPTEAAEASDGRGPEVEDDERAADREAGGQVEPHQEVGRPAELEEKRGPFERGCRDLSLGPVLLGADGR